MKEIMYKSTRSDSAPVTASRAILMGLAEDGGLFVPTEFPVLDKSLSEEPVKVTLTVTKAQEDDT